MLIKPHQMPPFVLLMPAFLKLQDSGKGVFPGIRREDLGTNGVEKKELFGPYLSLFGGFISLLCFLFLKRGVFLCAIYSKCCLFVFVKITQHQSHSFYFDILGNTLCKSHVLIC